MKLNKEQRKRAEKESKERRNHDHDDREIENNNNRDFNIQRLHDRKKSARKIEGFEGNANSDDKETLKSEFIHNPFYTSLAKLIQLAEKAYKLRSMLFQYDQQYDI